VARVDRWLGIGAAAIALTFLILPISLLLLRAVQMRGWESAASPSIAAAVGLSLVTTALTSLLIVIFGTPLAYALARGRWRGRGVVNLLIELPIVLPPAVAGLALLATFGRRGVFGTWLAEIGIVLPFTTAAVIAAQVFVSAPFYIRAAQIGFRAVPLELEEAAHVDGASGGVLLRRVMLPLAGRALAAGLVLSWARALGEFGATILFAGSVQGRTQTLPLLVYFVLEQDIAAALWTGTILVALAVVALAIAAWLRRDSAL